jgi:hypothetical protein
MSGWPEQVSALLREALDDRPSLMVALCGSLAVEASDELVQQAVGNAAEVRECAYVTVEEADLILTRVEPGEVSPRAHQAHDEQERLLALRTDVDEDLEEVHLAEVAGRVIERHEDLAATALPLGHVLPDHGDAYGVALVDNHAMKLRRRQALLALGPVLRRVE